MKHTGQTEPGSCQRIDDGENASEKQDNKQASRRLSLSRTVFSQTTHKLAV